MVEIKGVNIEAIIGCVPANKVNNLEFGERLFGNKIKQIIKATGIEQRAVCKNINTTSLDLCVEAAKELLRKCKINKEDIGAVIFVTTTPEYVIPNNATLVQDILELPKEIIAYDINLACSGYPYGLLNAAMLVNSMNKKVLLLDGDNQTHFTSPYDKSTSIIFADGGSATLLGKSLNEEQTWKFSFESDGSGHNAILVPYGGSKNWIKEDSLEWIELEDGSKRKKSDAIMDGMAVFNFATQSVPKNIKQMMEKYNITDKDVDVLALHQANKYLIKQIGRSLGIENEKIPVTINKYGNTCSSSIPILLADTFINQTYSKKILMSGFGAGLSIGTAFLETENTKYLGVIDYVEE